MAVVVPCGHTEQAMVKISVLHTVTVLVVFE